MVQLKDQNPAHRWETYKYTDQMGNPAHHLAQPTSASFSKLKLQFEKMVRRGEKR